VVKYITEKMEPKFLLSLQNARWSLGVKNWGEKKKEAPRGFPQTYREEPNRIFGSKFY